MATDATQAGAGTPAAGTATPAAGSATTPATTGTGAATGASSTTASSNSTTPATGTGTTPATGTGAGTSTTDQGKTGGTEGGEKTGSQDVELKFAEGVRLDTTLVDAYRGKAKELGLDSAKAQALADVFVAHSQALEQKAQQEFDAQRAQWKKALADDKEIGGANLKQTEAHVAKARDRLAPKDFVALIDAAGIGDHPEVVRFFARIGKAISEDSIQGTASAASASDSADVKLARRYDHPTSRK